MALNFELGDPGAPRGHALIYFTDVTDPSRVGASYVVVLPVNVDIAKYVPPFLAGQIESMGSSDMSAFSFPPAPEPVDSVDHARAIAENRDDDLLYGGPQRLDDAANLMGLVGDITAEYKALYDEFAKSFAGNAGVAGVSGTSGVVDLDGESTPGVGPVGNGDDAGGDGPDDLVDDFLYGLMSESDLLTEVSTLVGKLRYAIEGGDKALAEESEMRIRAAGKFMPENRKTDLLADAAAGRGPNAEQLVRLYLERAYGLLKEDYRAVQGAEDQIKELTGGE